VNRRRLLIALALLNIVSCNHDAPTAPTVTGTCANVSGAYDVAIQGACKHDQYPKEWVLVQDACSVRSNVLPDLPTVSGTVKGNVVHLVMQNGFIACTYHLEGDGQFDGQTIHATVSGQVDGPCCGSKQETLTIVAVRRPAGH
jgi:hypothetical protein